MSLRRVRPQIDDYSDLEEEEEEEDEIMDDAPSEEEDVDDDESASGSGSDQDQDGSDVSEEEEEEEDDEGESEPEEPATTALSKISFGTLSKAASSLRRHNHHTLPKADPTSARAAAIKAQLSSLKSSSSSSTTTTTTEARRPKPRTELKRSSKHAPQEVTSKRAVTRRREVVAPLVPAALRPRDPRFDDAVKGVFDERVFRRNYEFLEGYREEEVKVLKKEMEKEKDLRRKEEMVRVVRSMESRKHQQQQKARSEELLREHKKKEREMIKQGKKPFYLKKTEQKKMLLMDKYHKLNPKQLDKAIEKKRKRKAQKEHRNIPYARREA